MKRRDFLMAGGATIIGGGAAALLLNEKSNGQTFTVKDDSLKLTPPKSGAIPVAFLISERFTVIDSLGPWEVFQDVAVEGREFGVFELFTVAESLTPLTASGGLKVTPNYTFANAPQPKVIVIGAQKGDTPATYEWLKKVSVGADVVMSVCTGAFLLATSGLIDGKQATTHHEFYDRFAKLFPKVELTISI